MDKEQRNNLIFSDDISLSEEGRTVCGYAVRFNEESSKIGQFYEVILSNAITQETINNSDIYAKFNHRDDVILARSRYGEPGSLRLYLREDGLYYEFDAPHTAYGDELVEHIRRGEITKSSFAFTVADNGEHWYKENGQIYRQVSKIDKLYDIACVFEPAYPTSSCYLRTAEEKEKVSETIDNDMNAKISEINNL
jgi:hypothetical protein